MNGRKSNQERERQKKEKGKENREKIEKIGLAHNLIILLA